ncbi:LPFR motif small protein [Actinacidiphila sp. bgisy160]|uniref:LPFR motif small protein n=1 Tax=Actinacidiphila sp. bgisy160 TaxID=3413796 RepID=UPI003D756282
MSAAVADVPRGAGSAVATVVTFPFRAAPRPLGGAGDPALTGRVSPALLRDAPPCAR